MGVEQFSRLLERRARPVRVNYQEWPLEIKACPVEGLGSAARHSAHSFAKYANEWGTRRRAGPPIGPSSGTFALRRFRFLRMTRFGVIALTVVVVRTLADKSVRPTRLVPQVSQRATNVGHRDRKGNWERIQSLATAAVFLAERQ
jgi:hypothetical protein